MPKSGTAEVGAKVGAEIGAIIRAEISAKVSAAMDANFGPGFTKYLEDALCTLQPLVSGCHC